jgi:hypothetical protein
MMRATRISSLLRIAAIPLGGLASGSMAEAQEPLQFNVPYRTAARDGWPRKAIPHFFVSTCR